MSGHSHAATIKRKKEATDAKKGSSFSKISHLITIAVKEGEGITDPEMNPRLRLALEKAKEVNMPKENVQRAIARGIGEQEGKLESVVYEGFGPQGAAIVLECATDNKRRTASEVRRLFEQAGGRLAEPGAAAHFFERKGLIKVKKEGDGQEQALTLIDLGVEDVEEGIDFLSVYVPVGKLVEFAKKLVKAQFKVEKPEQVMKAKTKILPEPRLREKLGGFLESLKAHDDVEKVFVNF